MDTNKIKKINQTIWGDNYKFEFNSRANGTANFEGSYYLIVTDVVRPFPEIIRRTKQIPGRNGWVVTSTDFGPEYIEVRGVLVASSPSELQSQLSSFYQLYTFAKCKSVFPDRPNETVGVYLESIETEEMEFKKKAIKLRLTFVNNNPSYGGKYDIDDTGDNTGGGDPSTDLEIDPGTGLPIFPDDWL